jgi:hypothetical protein
MKQILNFGILAIMVIVLSGCLTLNAAAQQSTSKQVMKYTNETKPILFNLKWGISPEECRKAGMKSSKPSKNDKINETFYLDFRNANRKIGNIKISSVAYSFSVDNKLNAITAFIENDSSAFKKLSNALKSKYGKPHDIDELHNVYGHSIGIELGWFVDRIHINIVYNFAKDEGTLTYSNPAYSEKAFEKMEKDKDEIKSDL